MTAVEVEIPGGRSCNDGINKRMIFWRNYERGTLIYHKHCQLLCLVSKIKSEASERKWITKRRTKARPIGRKQ
jgi:hypothetical protein